MSAPIGPGDYVECVWLGPRSDPLWSERHRRALAQLRLGAIYLVTGVGRRGGIIVAGATSADEPFYGWDAARFRPVYRPRQDLIESLKAPPKQAPKRTPEHA